MFGLFKRATFPVSLEPVLDAARRHPQKVQREIAQDVRGSLMVIHENAQQFGSFHKEGAPALLREMADELQARRHRLQAFNVGQDDPRFARVLLIEAILNARLTADGGVLDGVMRQLDAWFSEVGLSDMTDSARKQARQAPVNTTRYDADTPSAP